jgi:trans-aconitate 3-methyltransferase
MEEGTMGRYWEQPGRNRLRDLYREIVPPGEGWEAVERREYEPATTGKEKGQGEVVMAKRMRLGDVEGYTRTFSAYHNWAEAHPDRKARKDGGEGDVVDELFEEMVAAEQEWKKAGEEWRDVEVEVEWGSVMLMARRK